MSDPGVDVLVVGAGLMGAATAWQVARRGRSVALLEAFDLGHRRGSSHGSSRIFRRAYADPFYVRLTGVAREAWHEASADVGMPLLDVTGGLDHGRLRNPELLQRRLSRAGVPNELLAAGEAAERFPGFRFDGPVLFHPEAGVLNPDAAVAAWVRRTRELGGTVLTATAALRVLADGDGVVVESTAGTLRATCVVVAAGAWLPELPVGVALPSLRVTQQQVFHFPLRDPSIRPPIVVHKDALNLYALSSGTDAGVPAMKIGLHDPGTPTTASGRDGVVDATARDTLVGYVREWLPGLVPAVAAAASCLYTLTDDEDFILDRRGSVVVVSACSGHGAKFAPLVGAMAADLALDPSTPVLPRFALGTATVAA